MRIRIPPFALNWSRIRLHFDADPDSAPHKSCTNLRVHCEPPRLQVEPPLYCEPLQLPALHFDAGTDPAFDFDADPNSKNFADPDTQQCPNTRSLLSLQPEYIDLCEKGDEITRFGGIKLSKIWFGIPDPW